MKTIKMEGKIVALAPIVHGGDEKTGSEVLLRKMKMQTPQGIQEIPYIEGNAVRGYLRRLAMQDFLERIDYHPQTPRLYHMFYSGGTLETINKHSGSYVDLELRRQIRRYLPAISVFGSSYGNQSFAGKLKVGKVLPICQELNKPTDPSFYELLDFLFQTRKDDLREQTPPDEEASKKAAIQMIISYQVFISGTQFRHYFVLDDTLAIEEAFFAHLLTLWQERPFLGGKANIGNGLIEFSYDNIQELSPPEHYLQFLEAEREKILRLIGILDV